MTKSRIFNAFVTHYIYSTVLMSHSKFRPGLRLTAIRGKQDRQW